MPITVDTVPSGLEVVAGGQRGTAPLTVSAVVGSSLTIQAPSPLTGAGSTLAFDGWSDGGARSHVVSVPAAPVTFTASYAEQPRVADGLTGLWVFEGVNGVTTVADTSGVSPPLPLTASAASGFTWLPGGGVHLDGTVAFTSSANATKLSQTAQASDEATLEVWLDAGKASPVRPGRIAGIMKDSARSIALSQGFFEGQPTTTYDARVRTTGSYGNPLATPAPSATTGVQHLVLRRAADGRTTVWLDGRQAAVVDTVGELNWTQALPFQVGGDGTTNRFVGDVYLVALYGRALSDDEILQNLAAGPTLSSPGGPLNEKPAVSAGPDVTARYGDTINVTGTASDDRLPANTLTTTWGGPFGMSFADPGRVSTTALVPGPGTYPLSLTANDGELRASDGMTLTVLPPEPDATDLDILLVAGTATPVPAGDRPIHDHLVAAGHHVTMADDDTVTAERGVRPGPRRGVHVDRADQGRHQVQGRGRPGRDLGAVPVRRPRHDDRRHQRARRRRRGRSPW